MLRLKILWLNKLALNIQVFFFFFFFSLPNIGKHFLKEWRILLSGVWLYHLRTVAVFVLSCVPIELTLLQTSHFTVG